MRSQLSKLALERFTSFGDLLKFLRRRSGLTQRELSISVGYSHAQISRLELNQRQPDLATVTARFIPALDLEDNPEVAERLLELALETSQDTEPVPGLPPYKGLQFFDESDVDLFFGREKLTRILMERLLEKATDAPTLRFLAIVGASGSGKSSILRAGLLPTVRRKPPFSGWMVHIFTPTERPLETLASTLTSETASVISTATLIDDFSRDTRALHLTAARITSKEKKLSPRSRTPEGVLLVIDQFEEVFTLCQSESERVAFIDNLMTAATEPGGATLIILALRADFYSHCAPYAALRDALAEGQDYIGAMNTEELRRAMEEPAKHGDWELEPGLVELLLQDIGAERKGTTEPGALPLMSHALLETWHRRQGRKLTVSGYLATGGVKGAIADTADDVFQNELDNAQQEIARNIFMRLTQFGEGEDNVDTRRRAALDELIHRPEDEPLVREVLTRLADARLITTDNEVAEVAHEALIREWPTLREWLEEDREGLRLHRHLTLAAESWEHRKRDPGDLYRGARLAQATAWAKKNSNALSGLESDFLEASNQLAHQEEIEQEAQRQRELEAAQALAETQQQAATQLRKRALYITGAFILALIMFGMALFQGSRARQIAVTAQTERRIATSRELASASLNNLDVDPERSILLALQSISTTRPVVGTVLPESLEALHRSIISSPIRMTLAGHGTRVLSADFSPNGKKLATIGDDGTVILWDAINGDEILRLPGSTQPGDFVSTQRVRYSPDGNLLAACNSNQVKLYDPDTGGLVQTLQGPATDTTALAFSQDGKYIAAGSFNGTTFVWEASTGNILHELSEHSDAIEGVTFSPDGKWLITASSDSTMKIWDATTGKLVHDFSEFTGLIDSVVYNPDGTRLAFGTVDGLHIWQLDFDTDLGSTIVTNQEILVISESAGGIFSPDGTKLAAPSGRNAITVRDANTGREIITLSGHTGWVMGLAFSPDGQRLASTSLDGKVKIWSLLPGTETVTVSGTGAAYGTRVAYNPNGGEFATNGGDGTATLWDAKTGQPRLNLTGHDLEVLNVAYSNDGKYFATGSIDGSTIVWDTKTNKKLLTLTGHEYGVRDIAFSPEGNLIATGGFDGTAKVWDMETGNLIREISSHKGIVLGVAFSPNGAHLATASTDATVKIWNARTWELLFTLAGHDGGIRDVAYSPDGSFIATASGDGTVILWETATGSKTQTLIGHSSGVFSVTFSPDGILLATGSEDNTAKIWDVQTGKELLTLPGNLGAVTGVAFSSSNDEAHLVVSSVDGVARVFLLDIEELLALAHSRITRVLTTEECRKYLHVEQCPVIEP